ncbi:RsmB/NOP family class I SAM-dependent RNA methyltransferase [Pseudolysinimonas yzui]|uniref:rRNA cytosine-C5-methyltransferase n=1 Tax=Pseudolysinimonas yzui TaxID=2708254 RepID=A0A8J3GP22_9MICO|nr:transcription antitermination factor NusB [Pseudolysinimonas yzui]GHF08930.1 rRNA cytosine-C5-methyltransferase [Pseudolysinimonas yzui]
MNVKHGAGTTGRAAPARKVAAEVLAAVRDDDAYANLLLPGRIAQAKLSPGDAALATELTYGTLRMQGRYDRIIRLAANRETDAIDPVVLDVLRLGVHQLLATRIPPHAAVGDTVALAPRRATGFVNGVLRTVSRSTPEEWDARLTEGLTGDARLAAEYSHPEWVVDALRRGLEADGRGSELEELLAADNVAPAVALVALPGLVEVAAVGEPGVIAPTAVRALGGDPAAVPAVAAGLARVQDEGSQLAAIALSRAREIVPGERWLDMCAGPGGKAALLAAEARIGGAELIANELVPARAGLVRRALAVFDPAPRVVEGDATRFATSEAGGFDRILLDAPCTGLGALRRRPEARWRKQPSDIPGLVALQARLLDAAVAALAPGGLLAYVTCSPHPDETRAAVAGVLDRHPELTAVDTREVVARIATSDLGPGVGPAVQLWPHRHGTDAMFIQLLSKVDA